MHLVLLLPLVLMSPGQDERGKSLPSGSSSPYARWEHGLPTDPGFFPIAVWLQDPRNAPRYKQAGINLYVALWRGPTEAQLAELEGGRHAGHLPPEQARAGPQG